MIGTYNIVRLDWNKRLNYSYCILLSCVYCSTAGRATTVGRATVGQATAGRATAGRATAGRATAGGRSSLTSGLFVSVANIFRHRDFIHRL